MTSKDIANRLKETRAKINPNLTQFSQMVNIGSSTISNYESGRNQPSFEYLQILATQFNVNLHWLITGEEVHPKHIDIDLTKVKGITIKF